MFSAMPQCMKKGPTNLIPPYPTMALAKQHTVSNRTTGRYNDHAENTSRPIRLIRKLSPPCWTLLSAATYLTKYVLSADTMIMRRIHLSPLHLFDNSAHSVRPYCRPIHLYLTFVIGPFDVFDIDGVAHTITPDVRPIRPMREHRPTPWSCAVGRYEFHGTSFVGPFNVFVPEVAHTVSQKSRLI